MIFFASKCSFQSFLGVVIGTGMMFLPVTVNADEGTSPSSSKSGTSGSQSAVSDVRAHTRSGFDTQWSDQLKRERDQAQESRDQALKELARAKMERDQAFEMRDQLNPDATGMQAIQGQSSSNQAGGGQGKQDVKALTKERDTFLQERNDLEKEITNIRQERDRAMRAIGGGSALDAVDRTMPVTPRH